MGGDVGLPLVCLMHLRLDLGVLTFWRDSLEKVKSIQEKLLEAQSRQKEYADQNVRDMECMAVEQVLVKVSPMKGVMRLGKRGKQSRRYI